MCQKQAVKSSHVIHKRRTREEGAGEEGTWTGGGHYKGWSDAVSVIKPAWTNTGQVFSTAHLACLNNLSTPG